MLDSIRLHCPECGTPFHQSVAYVQGQIKAMKQGKCLEVAQQMRDKRGPFYDKWLKAMKARGEQKRCKECVYFERFRRRGKFLGISCKDAGYSGGCFACPSFSPISED